MEAALSFVLGATRLSGIRNFVHGVKVRPATLARVRGALAILIEPVHRYLPRTELHSDERPGESARRYE